MYPPTFHPVSSFLGHNCSSGIARAKGSSIFSFLRKFHTVFHSGCTSPNSHQQCIGFPFRHNFASTCPLLMWLWWSFWPLWSVSHCGFNLHLSDGWWCWESFICLQALCMSSLEKCLFRFFAHFLNGLFVFLEWSSVSYLYILEIKPLSEVSLANIFPILLVLFVIWCCFL